MIRLIFCDMDGTLLDGNGNLPPMFEDVIARVTARGAVFCPASGRQYSALLRQMGSHIDDFIFVAENGTFVARHDRELFSSEMKAEDIQRVLDTSRSIPDAYPVLCGKRLAYVTKIWEPYLKNMRQYFTQCQIVEDLDRVAREEEIIKVAFCDAEHGEAGTRLFPMLEKLNGPVQVVLSSDYWIDVMSPAVNKGSAVRRLQSMLDVRPEECAAFGDYLNDAEMIRAVGHGYAMGNALPALKELAPLEAPPNTEYGVMTVLESLLDKGLIGNEGGPLL